MARLRSDYEAERSMGLQAREDDPASLVAARLRRSGYPSLWGIQCELRDDVVVLSGVVPTYHLKQLAQALALHTAGVLEVENCVRVTPVTQSKGLIS
jgi:osmotically-inducible protein OsmY